MAETNSLFFTFHFYLFGILAVASALAFVTRRSPVSAAMWLVSTMFSLAAMYVMLDAPFIGVIQVLVYAGAIMVVFLFVIMLLNLGKPEDVSDARGRWWKLLGAFAGLAILAQLFAITRVRIPEGAAPGAGRALVERQGAITPIAEPLFTEYLLAFEVTSVLLLAAVVGAVVVGRQRKSDPGTLRSSAEATNAR